MTIINFSIPIEILFSHDDPRHINMMEKYICHENESWNPRHINMMEKYIGHENESWNHRHIDMMENVMGMKMNL
jgi:tryptophan 2,3-dioxygenase